MIASCSTIVQLLMHLPRAERPDALLVNDDNLVPATTAGLAESGVRVPEEIDVVAHCNFPWATAGQVPIRRVGFDVRSILSLCLGYVYQLRHGQKVPRTTVVKALFDHEVSSGS
jgi:DNA-binding LacI/PurR family transcriptional regulator